MTASTPRLSGIRTFLLIGLAVVWLGEGVFTGLRPLTEWWTTFWRMFAPDDSQLAAALYVTHAFEAPLKAGLLVLALFALRSADPSVRTPLFVSMSLVPPINIAFHFRAQGFPPVSMTIATTLSVILWGALLLTRAAPDLHSSCFRPATLRLGRIRCQQPNARCPMNNTSLEAKVGDFLAQKRIAVAGVSRDNTRHPTGNLIYRRLKETGHAVFPVNPHMQTFEGDHCYPDLMSIPGGVDGVVIVTRPEITRQIVQDCQRANIPRVWMHQSAVKGTSVSNEAVEYCRQHNITVIAGACPMMYGANVDFGHTCMRWLLQLTGKLPT